MSNAPRTTHGARVLLYWKKILTLKNHNVLFTVILYIVLVLVITVVINHVESVVLFYPRRERVMWPDNWFERAFIIFAIGSTILLLVAAVALKVWRWMTPKPPELDEEESEETEAAS